MLFAWSFLIKHDMQRETQALIMIYYGFLHWGLWVSQCFSWHSLSQYLACLHPEHTLLLTAPHMLHLPLRLVFVYPGKSSSSLRISLPPRLSIERCCTAPRFSVIHPSGCGRSLIKSSACFLVNTQLPLSCPCTRYSRVGLSKWTYNLDGRLDGFVHIT